MLATLLLVLLPAASAEIAFINFATITGSTYQDVTTSTWMGGVFTAGSAADLTTAKLLMICTTCPATISVTMHEYNAMSQGPGAQLGPAATYTLSYTGDTYFNVTPATPWRLPTPAQYVRCRRPVKAARPLARGTHLQRKAAESASLSTAPPGPAPGHLPACRRLFLRRQPVDRPKAGCAAPLELKPLAGRTSPRRYRPTRVRASRLWQHRSGAPRWSLAAQPTRHHGSPPRSWPAGHQLA